MGEGESLSGSLRELWQRSKFRESIATFLRDAWGGVHHGSTRQRHGVAPELQLRGEKQERRRKDRVALKRRQSDTCGYRATRETPAGPLARSQGPWDKFSFFESATAVQEAWNYSPWRPNPWGFSQA